MPCNEVIPYFRNCSKENSQNYDFKPPIEYQEICIETTHEYLFEK